MSRKKNRKKNFIKQIAVVNKTPVKQEEQMVQMDLGPRRSVAFIGSECYPFVKTGGLGDVMSALPKTLAKLNLDVKVILPRYKCIPQKFQEKMEYRGSFYMDLCSDGKQYYVGIMEYQKDGVVYDFIDNDEFFSWGNPYTNLIDDIPKFCYFAKASLAALNYLDWTPDIVHCHDWQAALVPLYLRTCFENTNVGRASAVLTIHNLRFQGIYDRKMIQYWSGLPDYVFNKDCMIQNWLDANMLKGGIAYCNKITTVSNTYAGEIQTEEYGEGLAEQRNPVLVHDGSELVSRADGGFPGVGFLGRNSSRRVCVGDPCGVSFGHIILAHVLSFLSCGLCPYSWTVYHIAAHLAIDFRYFFTETVLVFCIARSGINRRLPACGGVAPARFRCGRTERQRRRYPDVRPGYPRDAHSP